jgi:hypothetical protein
MARIRSIKPAFFISEDVADLPVRARLTWIGLWTQADDHGRTKDNARLIKAALWSLNDDVTLDDIEDDLSALASHGRIVRYLADSRSFLAVVNWHVHQAINRPKASSIPAPGVSTGPHDPLAPGYCSECSASTLASVTAESLTPHAPLTPGGEGKGREGRGTRGTRDAARVTDAPSGPEPPRKCPTHEKTRSSTPCGACGDARREHESWTRGQKPKPTPTITTMCQDHPDQPAGRCVPCESAAVPSPLKRPRRPAREAS